MNTKIFGYVFIATGIWSGSQRGFSADRQPIRAMIDKSQIMERVQLVGVISGGQSAKSGIAVIRDALSGKTYAIKTGDSLPGVTDIKLKNVQREMAVFSSEGKDYLVRLSIGGSQSNDSDTADADLEASDSRTSGSGLFEKWYGSKIGLGGDLVKVESESTKDTQKNAAQKPLGPSTLSNGADQVTYGVSDKSDSQAVNEKLNDVRSRRVHSNHQSPERLYEGQSDDGISIFKNRAQYENSDETDN